MQTVECSEVRSEQHNSWTLRGPTRWSRRNKPGGDMCKLLNGQDPRRFKQASRSVRISGLSTSVRLEVAFWEILGDIAEREGLSVPRLIAVLHDEALDRHGDIRNLASLLRTVCLLYQEERAERIIRRKPPA